MPDTIHTGVADGIATITMDRPAQRNAMTIEMVGEVHHELTDLAARQDVRIVVLTGAGKYFCPGGDADALAAGAPAYPALIGLGQEIYRIPAILHDMPQLTIAAINGSCAGAAMGWVCGCDLRYAVDEAKFTTAFLPLGLAGDMSIPWSLPRIVGAGRARQLSFLSEVFDAREAYRIGLVNDVFPRADFTGRMEQILVRLTSARPAALLALKEHYVRAENMSIVDYADYETEWHIENFTTDGLARFRAGREPSSRGSPGSTSSVAGSVGGGQR